MTAKQTQRTSRSVNDQMIGTHVSRGSHARRGPKNASSVAFSNTRATNRATRGEVNTITPTTSSGESVAAYRQRARQGHYVETIQRRARRKRILAFVVVLAVIVAIAVGAGVIAFRSTVGAGMNLRDSDAASALVAPKADEATYTLISVDLGAVAAPLERSGPDDFILARLDPSNQTVALVNIPADLKVTLSDGETHRLYEASQSGDAALITAVSKFAGTDINHFVKIDEEGLVGLVDMLGGVTLEVDQVIDDPHAGSVYISPGQQTLSGDSMLTYLRATNVKLGVLDQMTHQLDFARTLLVALFADGGSMGFSSRFDGAGAYIQTDYSFDDIVKLQTWMKDMPADSYTCVTTPGYTEATTGVVEGEIAYFIASSNEFARIVEQLEGGENPNASQAASANLDKGSFTVAIQNGYNIAGAAATTADILRGSGFNVGEVGNAEQPVYEETLVVYKSGAEGPVRAQAVIDALGFGRAVYASYYYEFEGDVLVIIGADYMPTS